MIQQEVDWLLNEKHNGQKTNGFLADCARLKAGEPLGYIIGYVPFLNCQIWLDSHPLIPRPETEFWVEQAIVGITQNESVTPHVLDLCAGSGCVGVAIAKVIPGAIVDFAEIDTAHHKTIEKNLSINLPTRDTSGVIIIDDNKKIFGGDLFADIPDGTQYDFIVSNPPYIDPALDRTETSVKAYEPHQALYGGNGGIELIARIIANAPTHLAREGEVWLEHEPEQSAAIAMLAAEHGFNSQTHTDQYGVERYSRLVLQ